MMRVGDDYGIGYDQGWHQILCSGWVLLFVIKYAKYFLQICKIKVFQKCENMDNNTIHLFYFF